MTSSIAEPRLLAGRYDLEALLGHGGMAAVYLGRDRVLSRVVAVKVLASNLAHDPSFVERFRREARAAAGLSHPNVVRVYDTGSDGDQHYIVMEHVEGRTLAEAVGPGNRLDIRTVLHVASSVASALAAAHAHGLVHRDVKPGNIMLTPSGDVKVMDFGIARAASGDTLTRTANILGTAAYLSPEQAGGDRVDARSDLYSLGVVLYELLSGRPPFTGDSAVAVAIKHVRDVPDPLSQVAPNVPPALAEVVHRAMAKDPEERYPSADAMRQDLDRVRAQPLSDAAPTETLVADRTAELPPVAPTKRHSTALRPRPSRRWPAVAFVLATLLALGVIAILFLRSDGGRGSGATSPPASPSAASPSPSPSATPAPGQPLSVDAAVANLEEVLQAGQDAGEVTVRAAGEIARKANGALDQYDRGNLDKALEALSKLHDTVDTLAERGEITSAARADAIHQAVSDLETAMKASPPTGEDEGEG